MSLRVFDRPGYSRITALALAGFLLACGGVPAADSPPDTGPGPIFQVRLLDGSVVEGRVLGLTREGALTLEDRAETRIALDQVVSLSRDRDPARPSSEGGVLLFPEGDRLRAIIGAGDEAGVLETLPGALGDQPTAIPLDSLQGVILAPPSDPDALAVLVRRVREEPRDAEVLWLANGDRLTGSLLELGPEKVAFQPDTGPITLGRSAVVALGFDPALVSYPRPEGLHVDLTLVDGSRLGVRDPVIEQGRLSGHARFGTEVRCPLASIARLTIRGGAVSYLSERDPAGAQYVGYVGDHPGAFGRDQTWDGHPLRLAGRSYERGLGVLPRTLLAYRLDPADQRFQALVGLDDRAGDLASVVFRVLVDGKERYASPPLGRRTPPLELNVDISGGKLLILITEFGERGDVQDSADWIDARLVR